MPLYKNCGRWKNFDCIFGFNVKSYVRNTTNLLWDKILLTSVIRDQVVPGYWADLNVCKYCSVLAMTL
jgi:hypothetical protein